MVVALRHSVLSCGATWAGSALQRRLLTPQKPAEPRRPDLPLAWRSAACAASAAACPRAGAKDPPARRAAGSAAAPQGRAGRAGLGGGTHTALHGLPGGPEEVQGLPAQLGKAGGSGQPQHGSGEVQLGCHQQHSVGHLWGESPG